MKLLALLFYFFLTRVLGWTVLSFEKGTLTFSQRFFLAGPLGMGLLFLIFLWRNIFHSSFTLAGTETVLCVLLVVALISKAVFEKLSLRNIPIKQKVPFNAWEWLFLFFIFFQAGYILFEAFWRPVVLNDDWAQWAGNAKYLFYHGHIDATYFQETNHSNYPLFIMANEVVLCKIYGAWDDFLCKAFLTILVFDFAGFFFCIIREQSSRLAALAATMILLALPFYVRVGLDGTGEIPMSVTFAFFVHFMLRALEEKGVANSFFAAFFCGLLASIKNEGVFAAVALGLLFFVVLGIRRNFSFKTALVFGVVVAFFILPWMFLQNIEGSDSTRLRNLSIHWLWDWKSWAYLMQDTLRQFFWPSKQTLLLGPYFFGALFFFFLKNRKDFASSFLLLALGTVTIVYAVGSYVTGWGSEYGRLLTQLTALQFLFVTRSLAGKE